MQDSYLVLLLVIKQIKQLQLRQRERLNILSTERIIKRSTKIHAHDESPEGAGEVPTCPDGEPCVCIDVDGSCTDGDDDWGYVNHGDEGSDNSDTGDGSGDDENYCTVSPPTIELGAETLLTLIYYRGC